MSVTTRVRLDLLGGESPKFGILMKALTEITSLPATGLSFTDLPIIRVLLRNYRLLSLTCLIVLSGCSATVIDITGTYPSPLVNKLPLTLGVYYDEEFTNFSYIEINDENGNDQYIVNSGASQIELFNTLLPSVFDEIVLLDNLDELNNYTNLDAIFVPTIEEFQLGLPKKTRLDVYEIWVKYNMKLSEVSGDYIADWVVTAYGKSPADTFRSVDAGVNDAAIIALRDFAASFALGFSNIPEINEWLKTEDLLPD